MLSVRGLQQFEFGIDKYPRHRGQDPGVRIAASEPNYWAQASSGRVIFNGIAPRVITKTASEDQYILWRWPVKAPGGNQVSDRLYNRWRSRLKIRDIKGQCREPPMLGCTSVHGWALDPAHLNYIMILVTVKNCTSAYVRQFCTRDERSTGSHHDGYLVESLPTICLSEVFSWPMTERRILIITLIGYQSPVGTLQLGVVITIQILA